MRCSCCNAETETGKAKCDCCGFPVLVGSDDTEMTRNLIKSHRDKKIGKIKIFIKTYTYDEQDEEVKIKQTDYLEFADASSLQLNNIVWLSKSFEEMKCDYPFEIEFRIVNDQEQTDKTARIIPDKTISRSNIGIALGDGFTVRFAVGSMEEYCFSEPVALI